MIIVYEILFFKLKPVLLSIKLGYDKYDKREVPTADDMKTLKGKEKEQRACFMSGTN